MEGPRWLGLVVQQEQRSRVSEGQKLPAPLMPRKNVNIRLDIINKLSRTAVGRGVGRLANGSLHTLAVRNICE